MAMYDGSWQDVAARLRDDDLVSLNLINEAADMIERYGSSLDEIMERIEKFFEAHDDEYLLDDIWPQYLLDDIWRIIKLATQNKK